MRTSCFFMAVFLLASCAGLASAAPIVGVVVRDGADANWPGALVMRDIFKKPDIIGLLPEGTEVDILSHLSNRTYYYVIADGIRGWVKRQYIRELDGVPSRRQRAGIGRPVVFADIPANHWARQAVDRMIQAGLIEKRTNYFQGEKPVTRYELAVVLDRTDKRAEASRESIEARIRALEEGRGFVEHDPKTRLHHLMTLASTIRALQSQSEEMKGRLDALEPHGSRDMAMKLRIIEHRLDTIERSLGHS